MDPLITEAAVTLGQSTGLLLIGKKLFGKTLDTISQDINNVYAVGRDKIIRAAVRKTPDIANNAQTNLRVTRDVFWNGAFSDENICAEYFGGVLAASRSLDGKDDTGIFFLDIIKSMSSKQLHLHYVIYNRLKKFFEMQKLEPQLNVGLSSEIRSVTLLFDKREMYELGLNSDDSLCLHQKGLIHSFESGNTKMRLEKDGGTLRKFDQDQLPEYYWWFTPNSVGIQLFMQACNKYAEWDNFESSSVKIEDFQDIPLPNFCLGYSDHLSK
jgi:hypothetical protein